ncbi:decarboxylating NADP(+)-dependent phosphogluconate dehydrogenase [Simkania negevensis]|uniref:6-phosphogluconate dehydrogenase, decarboxylating n=1 Tax=Simkania negevensis (strain ATCC VR-1471 / DSM 27360 / Z) TaxID=331113 RepID=F8L6N2_SIMNZ|nr:decarboxylating NADP(+)-dependent phosphogluconate dehydrogenase [Simkania negevensis]CCB88380.1 6-phosphogluconate dehydrogenase,decarboxylating [Simkania negevensis Z]
MGENADIGLIGLAVMGQNLVLNMNDHGFKVVVYNRTTSKVDDFLKGPAKGTQVIGSHSLKEFVKALKRPRKVMLMIRAGSSVDDMIDEVAPLLEKGDIIIDGGNSHYPDSERRCQTLKERGILFIGTGISGGEEGARHGPSIMPGGNPDAWPEVKPIFQAIAAKSEEGDPCCDWVGEGGAGHYVKMVHNGIEYGDMQIICEAYQLLSSKLGIQADKLSKIFAKWNEGELNSYLIEITSQIFDYRDDDGSPLVEKILDVAGQKGTGKWTGISALDLGMPVTLIGEAVFARCLSALKDQRVKVSKHFKEPDKNFFGDKDQMIEDIRQALYASKIVSYVQGFMLMHAAAVEMGWNLNYGSIALMWRGGCIIRSRFLGKIKQAFDKNPNLESLLLDDFFKGEILKAEQGWRRVVSHAAEFGVPAPCFSTSLSFFDGYRSSRLPANLLQAQRDYFGAHTYERIDQPRGQFFHTNWTGTGGDVSSTTYNV